MLPVANRQSPKMIHQKKITPLVLAACAVVLIACFFPSTLVSGTPATVRIGVLADRGKEQATQQWSPTARYLSGKVPGHTFTIVPLTFQELGTAVERGDVDFVVTNSSSYVELESRYGVSRIATLQNRLNSKVYTVFGGVIFCRDDRRDIQDLRDLKGKSFMAVQETSLGGWQAAWREFKTAGIDPHKDFRKLEFGGTHDAVVYAVRDGVVDAGTVRTNTLESMKEAGLIDAGIFRILNPQFEKQFPFALSTSLYPEWPFAKIKKTSDGLAQDVLIALLKLRPVDPAARVAHIFSWTIPLDYQPVHELMRELGVVPYREYLKFIPVAMMRAYRYWIVLLALTLFGVLLTAVYLFGLNRRLTVARKKLEKTQENIEETVLERTAQLRAVNEELEGEIADRVQIEMEKAQLRRQLYHSQKMEAIGVLAGGIAHDFNNILTAIIGYGSLALKKLEGDPKLSKYLENILSSATRAATLTRGLLTFSKKQAIAPKPNDLNLIVKSVDGLLPSLIGEKIECVTELTDADAIVMADSGQIAQVIMNIATNAKDAMPEGGVFSITTSVGDLTEEFFRTRPYGKPGKYAVLTMTDTGVGMSSDIRDKIFDPFFTTKEVGKGTGLGLSVVFGIVEQHDGHLTVLSAPGKGTTFTIYLPIIREDVQTGKITRSDHAEGTDHLEHA